jgi:regulator of protease activity HflC (stomatin/prohibitin superfamily)
LLVLIAVVLFATVKIAQEYERAVIFRLGRIAGQRGPGLYFLILFVETRRVLDLRTVTVNIEQQETITKDSVTIRVNAVLWFQVIDLVRATLTVENFRNAVYAVALTSLRNSIGQHDLDHVLKGRDGINALLRTMIDKTTEPWAYRFMRSR